jgi:hypothetical protein
MATAGLEKTKHGFSGHRAASSTEEVILSRLGEPVRVQYVTPNCFGLLGVQPIMGRIFTANEMQDHSYAMVISSGFWNSHLRQ